MTAMDQVQLKGILDVLRKNNEDAGIMLEQLEAFVDRVLPDDNALLLSVLLAPFDALPSWHRDRLAQKGGEGKEVDKLLQQVYKLLDGLLKAAGPAVGGRHAAVLIDMGTAGFKKLQLATAKREALGLLETVLEWHLPGLPSAQACAEMGASLMRAYDNTSTHTKLADGVKGDVLQVLGLLLEHAPETFQVGAAHQLPDSSRKSPLTCTALLNRCKAVLMDAGRKKPAADYIAGALSGLSVALNQCEASAGQDAAQLVYQHIRNTLRTARTLTRYNGVRACLRLLSSQASLFADRLVQDVWDVVNTLNSLREDHSNKQVRDQSLEALLAVLDQVAQQMLLDDAPLSLQQMHAKLLHGLFNGLNKPECKPSYAYMAITVLGKLAGATHRFQGTKGVVQILQHVERHLQRHQLEAQLNTDEASYRATYDAALLEALAAVLLHLEDVPDSTLQQCVALINRLAGAYQRLWPVYKRRAQAAMRALLQAIASKPFLMQALVPQLVSMLLAHTVRPAESQIGAGGATATADDEVPAWRIFLPLWLALLQDAASTAAAATPAASVASSRSLDTKRGAAAGSSQGRRADASSAAGSSQDRHAAPSSAAELAGSSMQALQGAVYGAMLQSVLDTIEQLDLQLVQVADPHQAPENETQADAAAARVILLPRSMADMQVFLNLSAFTAALLPACGADLFREWAPQTCMGLVAATERRRMLSGCYRMLASAVRMAAEGGVLQSSGTADDQVADSQQALHTLLTVLSDFLQDVKLACRRYTDDLLEACLELLLAAPAALMPAQSLREPLQLGLQLGLQLPALAEVTVSALERWEQQQPDALKELAPTIIPALEPFLSEMTDWDSGPDSTAEEPTEGAGEPQAEAGEDAVEAAKAAKEEYNRTLQEQEASLQQRQTDKVQGLRALQPRIQAWLGRMGGAAEVLAAPPAVAQQATGQAAPDTVARWDSEDKLGISVPFPGDQEATLWLDSVLPRAAYLAEQHSDRATRVAAYEFLHAVTLWIVGINAKRPLGKDEEDFKSVPTKFHKILAQLYPALLRLASSAELVSKQLFGPLVMSLVHWLTKAARRESAETMTMLDAIMDGLTNNENGALRELCAAAACEFLVWSQKHQPVKKSGTGSGKGGASHHADQLNAAALLRRLFERLLHPEPFKRYGAAEAMARCAGVLTKDEGLADEFYLEALACCVTALRLAEHDAEGTGTRAAALNAIRALLKGAHRGPGETRAWVMALHEDSSTRRRFRTLSGFLKWLWQQAALPEPYCQQVCMWLLEHTAALEMADEATPGGPAPVKLWVEQALLTGTGRSQANLIQDFTQVPELPAMQQASFVQLRSWLQALEVGVAWSAWACRHSIIAPENLQHVPRQAGSSLLLPASLQLFLDQIASCTSGSLGSSRCAFFGCEKTVCRLSAKLLRFLQQMLPTEVVTLSSSSLTSFLMACLVAPSHLGVPVVDAEMARRLGQSAKDLLQQAAASKPQLLEGVQKAVATYLSSVLPISNSTKDSSQQLLRPGADGSWEWGANLPGAAALLQGLMLCLELTVPEELSPVPVSIRQRLPARLVALAATLQPDAGTQQRQVMQSGLSLALRLGVPEQDFLQRLLDPQHGLTFYGHFKPVVHSWLIFNIGRCAQPLLKALAGSDSATHRPAGLLLTGMLEGLVRGRTAATVGLPDPRISSVVEALLPHLELLHSMTHSGGTSAAAPAQQLLLLDIIGFLLELSPSRVLAASQPSSAWLLSVYTSMLRDCGHVMTRKRALELLPPFMGLPPDRRADVVQAVHTLVDRFPSDSHEFDAGTTQALDYATQLMALMDAIVAAARMQHDVTPLLQTMDVVLRELALPRPHRHQTALETRLTLVAAAACRPAEAPASVGSQQQGPQGTATALSTPSTMDVDQSSSPDGQQQLDPQTQAQAHALVEYAWHQIFMESGTSRAPLKQAVLQYLLVPLLQLAPLSYQVHTLQQRAAALISTIKGKPEGMSPSVAAEEGSALIAKAAAYRVLQVMYDSVPKEAIKEILKDVGGNKEVMMRAAKDFRLAQKLTDAASEPLAQRMQAAAFACSLSLGVATQDNVKILEAPLKVDAAQGMTIADPWRKLLDPDRELKFQVLTDAAQRASQRRASTSLAAVIERVRADRKLAPSTLAATSTLGSGGTLGSFGITNSQEGSLGADVAASQSIEGDDLMSENPALEGALRPDMYQQSLEMTQATIWQDPLAGMELPAATGDSLSVEDDWLDQHEVMLPLIQLIEKLAAKQPGSPGSMPSWMEHLHRTVAAVVNDVDQNAVPRIVRLFLVKAVVHVDRRHAERQQAEAQQDPSLAPSPSIFGQHAGKWFPAVARAITADTEDPAREGLHYLLLDVCTMFLGWPSIFPADRRGSIARELQPVATGFLSFLIRAAFHPEGRVAGNNFTLLKMLISRWGCAVPLPLEPVAELIREPLVKGATARDKRGVLAKRSMGVKLLNAALFYSQAPVLFPDTAFPPLVQTLINYLHPDNTQQLLSEVAEGLGIILARLARDKNLAIQDWEADRIVQKAVDNLGSFVVLRRAGSSRVDRFLTAADGISKYYKPIVDKLQVFLRTALRHSGQLQATAVDLLARRAEHLADLAVELQPLLPGLLTSYNVAVQSSTLRLLAVLLRQEPDQRAGDLIRTMIPIFTAHSSRECRAHFLGLLQSAWPVRPALHGLLRPPLFALLADPDPGLRLEALQFWHSELPQRLNQRLQAVLEQPLQAPGTLTQKLEATWAASAAAAVLQLPHAISSYDKKVFDQELGDCIFTDYAVDTLGRSTVTAGTMFASQSQFRSPSKGMSGATVAATAGGTQYTQKPVGMVAATQQGTLSQSFSLALGAPMDDMATLAAAGSSNLGGGSTQSTYTGTAQVLRRPMKGRAAFLGKVQRRRAQTAASAAARERKVTLLRKYRVGELPDIAQVTPASFLAPLGVLAARDIMSGQLVMAALWQASLDLARTSRDMQQAKACLASALTEAFSRGPKHVSFVACLQSFALADRGCAVPARHAADAAKAAGRLQAGALQIEEQLLFGDSVAQQPSAKRQKGNAEASTRAAGSHATGEPADWSALAELYALLGQDDVLHHISSAHIVRCPGTKRAMEAMTKRQVGEAHYLYGTMRMVRYLEDAQTEKERQRWAVLAEELLHGQQPTSAELDLWAAEQKKCLQCLGEWAELNQDIQLEVTPEGQEEESFDHSWLFNKTDLVDGPALIRPFLRTCLFGSKTEARPRAGSLVKHFEADQEKMAILESAAPVELVLQAAHVRQWERCQALLGTAWTHFREKWSGLHPLSQASRHDAVASLQPLAEVQEVLSLLKELPRGQPGMAQLQQLCSTWAGRWPSVQQPSAEVTLAVLHSRRLLLDSLATEWRGKADRQAFVAMSGSLLLECSAVLRQQGFLDPSAKLLDEHQALAGQQSEVNKQARLRLMLSQVEEQPSDELCGKLESLAANSVFSSSREPQLLLLKAQAHRALGRQQHDPQQASGHLTEAFRSLQLIVQQDADQRSPPSAAAAAIAEGCKQLAGLCNDLMQDEASDASSRQQISPGLHADLQQQGGLAALLVANLLRAMHLGGHAGAEAALLVPRILTVLTGSDSAAESARTAFAKGWEGVPLRFMLPWAAQMLTLLDADGGEVLLPVLMVLARDYQQQLFFPFRLSSQHYSQRGTQLAASLAPLLHNEQLAAFMQAMDNVTYPSQRWEAWHAQLQQLVGKGKEEAAADLWRDCVFPDLVARHLSQAAEPASGGAPDRRRSRTASAAANAEQGATVNSQFAKKFEKPLLEAFGKDGAKLGGMTASQYKAAADKLSAPIRQFAESKTGKRDLARLSHWFEAFTAPSGPGAGNGLLLPSMPSIQSILRPLQPAVHIVGFGKTVHVFSSKQKPKKLTIYGSDFREYDFMQKGGEELRIDQRVMQLFDLMNGLIAQQPSAPSNLRVRTYSVIPFTSSLGLMEFVPDTQPYKAVVSAFVPEKTQITALDDMRSYIFGGNQDVRPAAAYEAMFRKQSRAHVASHFEALLAKLRWDGLREALLRNAGSPELFLVHRAAFTASVAAMSIAGYVAGTGDRHSENILLHMPSGVMVPIDFGYSFDTGVSVLPIPELMPFRLTQQMLGVLEPLDAKVLLRNPMAQVMTALCGGRDVLQGVCLAFMREPLIDWQREGQHVANVRLRSSRTPSNSSAAVAESAQNEHLQLKMDAVAMKLAGRHPAEIMVQELAQLHEGKPYWPQLQRIVRGDAHRLRAQQGVDSEGRLPSAEAQIDCLLDHATDPDILGRTWLGWRPFL